MSKPKDDCIKEAFTVYKNCSWDDSKAYWTIERLKARKTKSMYIAEERSGLPFGCKTRFYENELVFSREEAINKKISEIESSIEHNKKSLQKLLKDWELVKKISHEE